MIYDLIISLRQTGTGKVEQLKGNSHNHLLSPPFLSALSGLLVVDKFKMALTVNKAFDCCLAIIGHHCSRRKTLF